MISINSKLLCLLLLILPATSQAFVVRADYVINFYPPSPCLSTSLGDLTGANINGSLQFYSQSPDGGALLAQNPGPPVISDLACGSRLTGTSAFNLDSIGGAQLLYLSFDGSLVGANPSTLTLPLYAVLSGSDVNIAPDGAPVLGLGLTGPATTGTSSSTLPLYAFDNSGHEMGSMQVNFSVVPIPGSLVLLVSGMMMLLGLARARPH